MDLIPGKPSVSNAESICSSSFDAGVDIFVTPSEEKKLLNGDSDLYFSQSTGLYAAE
jgi:hypothetical protein